MSGFDAVLLLSFGGPEGPNEVMPFLQRVTAGRGIPPERLASVAAQYEKFGGISPINAQNRQLRADLEAALDTESVTGEAGVLPVYWANRNWDPFLPEVLRQMRADGIAHAAVVVTSGYSSYSGCRQYRENLFDAVAEVESDGLGSAPILSKIRRWFDHPAYLDVMTEHVLAAIGTLPLDPTGSPHLVFTTHSIPVGQAARSGDPALGGEMYVRQHRFVAETIADRVAATLGRTLDSDLVFQSRSGPPAMPWLEPDVNDFLGTLSAQGARQVVIVPIGFMSDHMEVLWDLDTVAMDTANELGLIAARASTVGNDPRFVAALASLVRERERQTPMSQRPAMGPWGPAPDRCPAQCCANPRGPRPALCGDDS